MSYLIQAWLDLFAAQGAVGIVKVVVMWVLGGVLIFLAIKKDMEPALLLPIGFGAILVNIPGTSVLTDGDGTGIFRGCTKSASKLRRLCRYCCLSASAL